MVKIAIISFFILVALFVESYYNVSIETVMLFSFRCYRKYQDALEEKEFFDMNISNLTQELQDLRCVKL